MIQALRVERDVIFYIGRLQSALRTPRNLSMVPMFVHAVRARDEAIVNAVVNVWRRQPADTGDENASVSQGLQFIVQCVEEGPLNTAELHERVRRSYPTVLVDGGVFTDPSVCERLHSFRENPQHARPVESEIPTLIVTSEFDPRRTDPWTDRSAFAENSQLAGVPGAAHSGAFDRKCTRTMARDFLNAPFEKRDMSCRRTILPLKFVTDVKAILR